VLNRFSSRVLSGLRFVRAVVKRGDHVENTDDVPDAESPLNWCAAWLRLKQYSRVFVTSRRLNLCILATCWRWLPNRVHLVLPVIRRDGLDNAA
jgi:hypothetical protein